MTPPWWPESEAAFWSTVEDQMVELSLGTPEGTRQLVRSKAGRFVLTGLRRTRGLGDDPMTLARAAHAL